VVAIIGCAITIAACGSSGSTPSHSGGRGGSFVAFSECMRSHGVPNFPDPSGGGGINIGANINPASPAFKAAQVICRKKLPGGGPPPPSAATTAHLKTQLVAMAECMRAHGVTGFPDPTTASPPSNPAGYAILEDDAGVVLAIPASIGVGSPAFKQAAKACNFS
jgi:hypothetical protein